MATPITVALRDSSGATVAGALTCASANTVALRVAADCSSVTGMRLGVQTLAVSAGSVSANVTIKVIPQAQPIGTQGSAQSHNLVVTPAGKVLAWGANYKGVLGQGKTYTQVNSVALPTRSKTRQALGAQWHCCRFHRQEGTALA
ncbi:MAG: hypothetical protein IPH37_15505 [Burkholderiales bacterium]|nr:hypothetical protein [Burkholderiales bacterium]